MKQPLKRGTAIDIKRFSSWAGVFSGYRHTVTEERIERWLNQFNSQDRDTAARVLDCIDFVTNESMATAFRSSLKSLSGWNKDSRKRKGAWRFVAFSSGAGESGDTMLHKFRLANNLAGRQFKELFIYKSQLLNEQLGAGDTVVFVDDFAGTGTQICEGWKDSIQEVTPENANIYIVLVATSLNARKRIEEETEFSVCAQFELKEKDNFFSPKCKHFTPSEKGALLQYCKIASKSKPKGHGECGFVIVFAHNCPNNSIPILHAYNNKWEGLFRRYD